jgi:hypothetical protein
MQSLLQYEDPRDEGGPPQEIVNVIVLYDDITAGKRAVAAVNRITDKRRDIELHPKLWRFDLLNQDSGYAAAMDDCLGADIIFISTSGRTLVPPILRTWLGTALGRENHPVTVVFVGGEEELSETTLHNMRLIQELVEENGIDFFSPLIEPCIQRS